MVFSIFIFPSKKNCSCSEGRLCFSETHMGKMFGLPITNGVDELNVNISFAVIVPQ